MTTLITGGAGFVGLALAERLRGDGERVVLADLPARDGATSIAPPAGCEFVGGDLRDDDTLDRLFAAGPFDGIVHAAAVTPSPQRERDDAAALLDINVTATARLLQRCARERGIRRVVVVSSVAVYGYSPPAASGRYEEAASPPAPAALYGISKLAAEQAALRIGALHGLDVRVARLGPVFGRWEHASGARGQLSPHHQALAAALRGDAIVLPRAMPADWIYAPDAADALARITRAPMLDHPVYHVGGGALTDVAQWCAALARVLPGVRWRIADKGEPCTVQYALPADRPALDTTRLASELGHRCRFGLDESARDFLDWIAATSAQPFPSSSQEARDAAA
ncbi:NAD-dependent epimerase/dehydratase family protein [Paraburkholderia caballeronis]|uniref:UDP-glucose 4-epimerase/UDP-glucuronate 4-epimerase n=1 Tax=Paraburkholderia caballeronis TaxID=416943 RepID=A0A1H7FGZ1_9BURK|nr:NAD(P)-dependent oxidoreductase [Paraburkholderia caballeronis]PXW24987.1 UDP-glucose 4-epimerase/UDP-glucuronate 4-epimerase [Paraburkholderia caballeronis]PXX00717.1 UDP-glucose 4-epimerase/UDP-glucuronate 4-epimerase [Paraburkholderia caballeronis]RAJ98780.1 UDP-glucose 4-epimerase/UDP-glucuronate 4-epimerase [Paraburkholderia caballeronis]SEE72457.1 UDP-glucose 4-epimerase/UDP-glucuronate 4-epimerase [Paraburkholderia caballeronis]SEK25238.1 UDP-glucose 4-epimerase/UDP-glucuronate 4-epi